MEMYHNDNGNGHVSQRGRDYITSVDEQIFDSSVQIQLNFMIKNRKDENEKEKKQNTMQYIVN